MSRVGWTGLVTKKVVGYVAFCKCGLLLSACVDDSLVACMVLLGTLDQAAKNLFPDAEGPFLLLEDSPARIRRYLNR